MDEEVSSWKSVLSGVPQGSVLRPILFLVYINDLEEGVTGSMLTFADDSKLFRKTKEIGDKKDLQDDIDKLVKWSEKWQMLFNFGKCKCLHTGPGNTGMNYAMGGTILSKTVKEKDFGVTMNANMKVSEQCRGKGREGGRRGGEGGRGREGGEGGREGREGWRGGRVGGDSDDGEGREGGGGEGMERGEGGRGMRDGRDGREGKDNEFVVSLV